MSRAVDLVLPYAGPLISLAHADRLDLLELFLRPIVILDVVRMECLRKPDAPDHPRLEAWFSRIGNRAVIAETPIGPVYRDAIERERAGSDPAATQGLGDAALSWALRNVERLAHPEAIPLVLVEDRKLALRLQGLNRGHVLSTRAWLVALDEVGVIRYEAVVAQIARHGRDLSRLTVDKPIDHGSGPSGWLDMIERDRGRGGW